MAKIIQWNAETAQRELQKRLSYAKSSRKEVEQEWRDAERILFGTQIDGVSLSFRSRAEVDPLDWEASHQRKSLSVNMAFKNHRFLHSQLAANPPTVVPKPTSSDPSDIQKANAADRLIRYALRTYKMQEKVDLASSNCLLAGSSVVKIIQDADAGDILAVDLDSGEAVMEGDIKVSVPSHWHLYPDPDASLPEEVKWIFELIYMPYEEACFRFPDKKDILDELRIKEQEVEESTAGSISHKSGSKYDVVPVYQYWEKGEVYNGLIGRFCYCVADGRLLTPVGPSPHRFNRPANRGIEGPGSDEEKMPSRAELPYIWFTDVDVPGRLWGRSTAYYQGPLQDLYNQMLNVMVDTLEAHGVPRLILPAGSEISDESITNTPWDIIKIDRDAGQGDPKFMEPMAMPPAFGQLLQLVSGGINDMAGVNDSMFGIQQREQSGFSMQYATNQGNMIRKRLFNKYVQFVEDLYRTYLNLIRKHWQTARVISVLGKEKAFDSMKIKGADIDGGYDIIVEYGASLSLDPTTRREEILTLMPLFEKAGVPTETLLRLMKLNDLDSIYDSSQMAGDRQREIFDEMVLSNLYIQPREMQDHPSMLAYAYKYLMTSEFKYLKEEQKALVEQHIRDREQLAASQAQGAPGAAGLPGMAGPDTQLAGPEQLGAATPPGLQLQNA
jgi:hypothetical protein